MDTLSPEGRSHRMSLVRSKDTRPEMHVRRLVYSLGHRYRLHAKDLPGKPDLVFRSRRQVIFVHGCFWHRHRGCVRTRLPKSKLAFWQPKLEANRKRDIQTKRRLTRMGWRYLVVWECELSNEMRVAQRIRQFLGD